MQSITYFCMALEHPSKEPTDPFSPSSPSAYLPSSCVPLLLRTHGGCPAIHWRLCSWDEVLKPTFKENASSLAKWLNFRRWGSPGQKGSLPGSGNQWGEINLNFHPPCPTPNPQGPFSLPHYSSTENDFSWWYLNAKGTLHLCGSIQVNRMGRYSLSCYLSTYPISSICFLACKA